MASPRYGERMAFRWMEAARFSDTNGYSNDGVREMWPWRDWVIDAFNRNLPYDRFTVDQIAGDLLPNPEPEKQIATGFNRNHRTTAEGGVVPEEFRVDYAADRTETTATVWMGSLSAAPAATITSTIRFRNAITIASSLISTACRAMASPTISATTNPRSRRQVRSSGKNGRAGHETGRAKKNYDALNRSKA